MRSTKKYNELPFNPKLRDRAKALRKAGNLSEALLWRQLKNGKLNGYDFDRQKIIGNYIVDFYCARCDVVIEIDGGSHKAKAEYDSERNAYLEREIVNTLSDKLGTNVIGWIPRDNIVQECELAEKTVMEGNPASNQAQIYTALTKRILENNHYVVPTPLSDDEFDKMIKEPLIKR